MEGKSNEIFNKSIQSFPYTGRFPFSTFYTWRYSVLENVKHALR